MFLTSNYSELFAGVSLKIEQFSGLLSVQITRRIDVNRHAPKLKQQALLQVPILG